MKVSESCFAISFEISLPVYSFFIILPHFTGMLEMNFLLSGADKNILLLANQ